LRAVPFVAPINGRNHDLHGERLCDCGSDARRGDALMQRLASLFAGLLFGAGLAVSGMIDPDIGIQVWPL
jgi:hypothetical protein